MIHYTVYKTVNLLTGEYYIGVHKTENPDDCYLGSGYHIVKAVKEQGTEHFKKDVLFSFNTPEFALDKEYELLKNSLNDPLCYNLGVGGRGGLRTYGGYKRRPGKKLSLSHRKNLSLAWEHRIITPEMLERLHKNSEAMIGQPLSSNHKKKLSVVFMGTILINNGSISKRHPGDQTIPEGWKKGRLNHKKKRVYSQTHLDYLASEEYSVMMSERMKKIRGTPEARKKASDNMSKIWENRRKSMEVQVEV